MKIISINGEEVTPSLNGNPWDGDNDLFAKCVAYDEPERAQALGIYPFFRPIEEMDGAEVICEGKRVLMVGSNNYLGLANDSRVVEAAVEATRKYASAAPGSVSSAATSSSMSNLRSPWPTTSVKMPPCFFPPATSPTKVP